MVARIGSDELPKVFLAEWREHRRLTQDQLADAIGSTKGSISRWENGERDMTLKVIGTLARALDCNPADLFRRPTTPSADEILREMDTKTRARALRLLEALKDE